MNESISGSLKIDDDNDEDDEDDDDEDDVLGKQIGHLDLVRWSLGERDEG